jgi:hypothetical protein
MYLSGAQIGIQTAHVVSELFLKYQSNSHLNIWAEHDKTIICLNGGDHESLKNISESFADTNYAYAEFYEPGLNNAITAVGIIVSERIYKTAKEFRENGITTFDLNNSTLSENETLLINFINTCTLAR